MSDEKKPTSLFGKYGLLTDMNIMPPSHPMCGCPIGFEPITATNAPCAGNAWNKPFTAASMMEAMKTLQVHAAERHDVVAMSEPLPGIAPVYLYGLPVLTSKTQLGVRFKALMLAQNPGRPRVLLVAEDGSAETVRWDGPTGPSLFDGVKSWL